MGIQSFFSIFTESANSFEGKEPGEEVILLVRRHPFFMMARIGFIVLTALIPLFSFFLFSSFLNSYNTMSVFLFASSIFYLFLWQMAFYTLTMYTLDVWIVTNKRIIDSEQHGFFNRKVSELHLSRVQDISVKTTGIIQTMFKIGDVEIQTAGTESRFHFFQVPEPEKIKSAIMAEVNALQAKIG